FLAVNRDGGFPLAAVAIAAGMRFDEFFAGDKHAAGAAARVVDAALVRRQNLDQDADDTRGRVELTAALALGAGEAREEILVDAAERVLGAIGRSAERDIAHEVDDLTKPHLVETWAGEVLRQH